MPRGAQNKLSVFNSFRKVTWKSDRSFESDAAWGDFLAGIRNDPTVMKIILTLIKKNSVRLKKLEL